MALKQGLHVYRASGPLCSLAAARYALATLSDIVCVAPKAAVHVFECLRSVKAGKRHNGRSGPRAAALCQQRYAYNSVQQLARAVRAAACTPNRVPDFCTQKKTQSYKSSHRIRHKIFSCSQFQPGPCLMQDSLSCLEIQLLGLEP